MTARPTLLVLLTLLLASCSSVAETDRQGTGEERSSSSQDIVVGDEPLDLDSAVKSLTSICLEPRPSFADSPKRLKDQGFRRRVQTGTYFHPKLNLSINLNPINDRPACSMVFVSEIDRNQLAVGLALASQIGIDDGRDKIAIGVSPDLEATSTDVGQGQRFEFEAKGSRFGESFYRTLIYSPETI